MDEFDPKERVEAVLPPIESPSVEELPEGDDDGEAFEEGDAESEAVSPEGGAAPGEPSRKRRRRRRR